MEIPDDLVSLTEAAAIAGFSRQGLWHRIHREQVEAFRVGREWLISKKVAVAMRRTKSKGGRPRKNINSNDKNS